MPSRIRHWFAARPLRVRLTLWYILVMALTLLILTNYVYLRVQRDMIAQIDNSLQVTASQALVANLEEENGRFSLGYTGEVPYVGQIGENGFAMRLTSADGTVLDGWGEYEAIPSWASVSRGYVTLSGEKTNWRLYSQPIETEQGTILWLQVAQSLARVQQTLDSLRTQLMLGVPLVMILAGLGGIFLAGRALRPINQITRTAQSISGSDLKKRINYHGAFDEVGRLAKMFDEMLDRLSAAFGRERQFTSDAAHELRTPLTVLKGQIGVTLSRVRNSEEYERILHGLEEQVDRLIRLTTDLLFLSRLEHGRLPWQPETIEFSDLLAGIVEQVQPLAESKGLNLTKEIPPGLSLRGAPDHLIRLFLNLLDNAISYTQPGGQITVRAEGEDTGLHVSISDTGPGIPPEHLTHLFDRFHRVEAARSRATGGAGLGLAIAYEIAQWHGGRLEVRSELGRGTTFTVHLPISPPEQHDILCR
jgi:heavy metal sensor kinase